MTDYINFERYSALSRSGNGASPAYAEPLEGAGLLILSSDMQRMLLLKRSARVSSPGLWSVPGGMREKTRDGAEDLLLTAVAEAKEEIGELPRGRIRGEPHLYRKPGNHFVYRTFVLETDPGQERDFVPRLDWEHESHRWFDRNSAVGEPLHPGLVDVLANYRF